MSWLRICIKFGFWLKTLGRKSRKTILGNTKIFDFLIFLLIFDIKYIFRLVSSSWSRICIWFHFLFENSGRKSRKTTLSINGYDEKFDFFITLWIEDIKYINRFISMSWLRICIWFYFLYETSTQKTIKIIRKNRLFHFLKNLGHQIH